MTENMLLRGSGAWLRLGCASVLALSLSACGSGEFGDLDQFMAEVKSKPQGVIEPMPTFAPYKPFTYAAAGLRAPFDVPVKVKDIASLEPVVSVRPDPNRQKEFLEGFSIENIHMVGTLFRSGVLWVLLDDGQGGVHRVTTGNYVGRNNGKIVEVSESFVSVKEIVPNGADNWVERPRTLKLKESK